MIRAIRAAQVLGAVAFSLAHIGSPDTIFEGKAGPYPLRVVIRTPGVVPGLADIVVRITGGPGNIQRVTVLPLRGGLPTAALPPPDTARPVSGDPNLLSAQLWLMSFGAYSVQVTVVGEAGEGSVIVPVNALATRRLPMDRPMAVGMIAIGLFLFIGAVTIVAAAVRESVLPPGQEPDARRRALAWIVGALSVLVFGLGLVGAKMWWDTEDAAFRRRMYKPPAIATSVLDLPNGRVLRLAMADTAQFRRNASPIIPDHGKLMHLFLIGAAESAAFAHLHPVAEDSVTFNAALPPLPPGTYRVFADIVHETGFSQTLTDTIVIDADRPKSETWKPSDPDDSWQHGAAAPPATASVRLANGATMRWDRPGSIVAGEELDLRFEVPGVALEPYMKMAGHAVIARDDGEVFIHLHPLGTIATAAQLVYALREPGDTIRGQLGRRITAMSRTEPHAAHIPGSAVSFPYAFPEPGHYRIWVQVKSGGRILTGAFQAEVGNDDGIQTKNAPVP